MFGKINDLEIAAPSEFSVEDRIIGGSTSTLMGNKRHYVKAIKKVWTLSYNKMSMADYDLLYAEFEKGISTGLQEEEVTATFTLYEGELKVNNENVHIDISDRDFLGGTDFVSGVEIILTQV